MRLSIAGLVVSLLVGALVGCDRRATSARAATSASERPVRLGYFANLTHAQAVLGVDAGDFANAVAPAAFNAKVFNAGPGAMEALLAGQIDVAYVGPGPVLNAHERSRGRGVRVIAGAARNGVVIVARKGAGVRTLADLKNKKLATPQLGNTQDIAARHYLKFDLGRSSLDNVLPVANAEQVALMLRGQIDAAWVPEPWGARLIADAGAELIAEERDLWPAKAFDLTVIATTPEYLSQHADVLAKLLAVHRTWTTQLNESLDANANELTDALAKLTGKPLPPNVLREALGRVTFTDEPSPTTFETNAKWAADLGLSRSGVDLSMLIDRSVLERVRKESETADAGSR